MAIEQFRATAKTAGGLAVDIQARQFTMRMDEPAELGGEDTGMNPVEAVLGALASCQVIVGQVYAKKFRVKLEDFRVEVEGDLDLDGLMDKGDVRPGFQNIRYTFHITSPSERERIDKLAEFLQAHCPVGDSLANPVGLKLAEIVVNAPAAAASA